MGQHESLVKKVKEQNPDDDEVLRIIGHHTEPARSLTTSENCHGIFNDLVATVESEGLTETIKSAITGHEHEENSSHQLKKELSRVSHGHNLMDIHFTTFVHLVKELWHFHHDYKKAKREYEEHQIWKGEYFELVLKSAYKNLGGLMFGVSLGLEFCSGDSGVFHHLLKLLGVNLDDFYGGKGVGGLAGKKMAHTLGL